MLSDIKSFVKQNQADIFIVFTIALVALFSFGLGRLSAPQDNNQPIVIENPQYTTASIQEVTGDETKEQGTEQSKLVGSVNSNKYHWPDCPWAQKIAPQNQVWFSSEKEAQKAGYIPCGNFEKYAP